MRLASTLVVLSAIVFAVVVGGYLVAPGLMLSVVGIASEPQSDFLMRTEGVALIAAAVFLWASRGANPGRLRIVLGGLSLYYVLGSIVDLAAYSGDIVGALSIPSALIRTALGVVCAAVAVRLESGD